MGHETSDPRELLDLSKDIQKTLEGLLAFPTLFFETTPFVSARQRLDDAYQNFFESIDGFFTRQSFLKSVSHDEKKWILNGMIVTRAVDAYLKRLFLSGEIKYQDKGFQGKGFRSLGQEAIYAAALNLRRGNTYNVKKQWKGDVIAPLIRDLGLLLAFTDNDIELVLNGQAGKDAPPLFGKDLHVGDLARGVLTPCAPLAISTCTAVGMAYGMQLQKEDRVAVSLIGEGGSSLGEWHEAINFAAATKLPIIFCVQNNQRALSTPVTSQSAARVFGEKATGYGLLHVTLDGTEPEAIAAAFAWGATRARGGHGPVLIELVSMRMCGHAHHDDMLYLGHDPKFGLSYPTPTGGYVNQQDYARWSAKDPLVTYAQRLINEEILTEKDVEDLKQHALQLCDEALLSLHQKPWPSPVSAGKGVYHGETKTKRVANSKLESAPVFSPQGQTYLEAISIAIQEILTKDPKSYVLGEDVGLPYGNAFMLFKSMPKELASRFINTPIAENAIIGACVGMALEGLKPIGEMQFNDFVASGFNQLVNNAAKFHYRTGVPLPMVLRMPWGGLRRAGPYHSQDTMPWFYRTPGLKVVAPSTPHDARGLLHAAVEDPNPVLFYEHIALYRDPSIKQILPASFEPTPLGQAAFRNLGTDISLISYGAFVHRALACAKQLEAEGFTCDVLDLRSLAPLDFERITLTVQRTGRVLLVGEDSKRGSILESIASQIGEQLFSYLDAPVRVLGSLDTPVPYSPPLEDGFLVSQALLYETAKELLKW